MNFNSSNGNQEITEKTEIIIDSIVKERDILIQNKVDFYFDSLKQNNVISSNINPTFDLENVTEDNDRILRAEYSYETIDEQLEAEITDYKPGKFRVSESPAAYALLQIVDNTIQTFLRENLEKAEQIQIKLHGFSDALPFDDKNPVYYDGLEGSFPKAEHLGRPKLNQYVLNGTLTDIYLDSGDTLNNDILAFLRAYCLKEDYLKDVVLLREVERKTQYTYHATTNNHNSGGKYRKVKIIIDIVNTQLSEQEPETIPVDSSSCFFARILMFIGILLLPYALYHYTQSDKKRGDQKEFENNRNKFFLILFIAAVLIIIAFCICPNLTYSIL